MSGFADMRDILAERIARQQAAFDLIARAEAFQAALEDLGFGVRSEIVPLSDAEYRVSFAVICPAGVVAGAPVELVEPAPVAEAAPAELVEPVAEAAAPVAETKPEPAPAPAAASKSGTPWSEDEDRDLIAMIARGVVVDEAARRLGRPVEGTRFRCKTVLREQISAAKVAAAKARKRRLAGVVAEVAEAPAPQPVSAPDASARPTVVPSQQPGAAAPARSPIAGLRGDDVTVAQCRAHLRWLYGSSPDRDMLECDLELVEGLFRGEGAGGVAAALEWSKDQVLDRWCALRGGVPSTLQLQERLLTALRAMAQGVAA